MALFGVTRPQLLIRPLAVPAKAVLALPTQRCYQTRTLWVIRHPTARSIEGRNFFSQRDVHYHFSKPPTSPPTPQQSLEPGRPQPSGRKPPPPKTGKWTRRILIGGASLIAATIIVPLAWMGLDLVDMIWEEGDGINFERFVPYEVVSNRKVTATSFILTVQPKFFPKSPLPYFLPDGSWWDFVWSVQVKQPELQIQREYTPLPPFDEGLDQRAFFLRFFIRRVDGGEVSRYLSKLQPGDEVELRMAKPQYDFSYRGTNVPDRVSIIASGTGIATALQIAHILLKDKRRVHPDTSVRMFWLHRDVREFYADNNIYESCNLIAYDGQKFELPPKLPLTTIGVAVRRLMQRDGERFWAQFYDFPDEKFAQMVIDMDKVDELKRSGVAPASYPAVLPRRLAASCKAVTNGQYPLQESHLELPEEIHNPYFVIGPEPFVERFAGRLVKKPGQEPRREGGLLGYLIPKKVQEHQGKEPGPAEFVVGMV